MQRRIITLLQIDLEKADNAFGPVSTAADAFGILFEHEGLTRGITAGQYISADINEPDPRKAYLGYLARWIFRRSADDIEDGYTPLNYDQWRTAVSDPRNTPTKRKSIDAVEQRTECIFAEVYVDEDRAEKELGDGPIPYFSKEMEYAQQEGFCEIGSFIADEDEDSLPHAYINFVADWVLYTHFEDISEYAGPLPYAQWAEHERVI